MRAVVGLGSNLGDRLGALREARAALERCGALRASSSVWETAPVGGPPQGPFLNAALALDTPMSAVELLDAALAIELRLGRTRELRWGPRTIDLDLLWIDGLTVESPRLTVPHPRLHERAFAVVPLLEVAPDAPYAVPASEVPLRRVCGPDW